MRLFQKYKIKLFMLAFMCLCFFVQVKAQFDDDPFDDDGGPGGFDPPPENDVPLDTYQWIMLAFAVGYGIYIFWKHYKKNKEAMTLGSE
jgi:hypothetical protein